MYVLLSFSLHEAIISTEIDCLKQDFIFIRNHALKVIFICLAPTRELDTKTI